MLANWELLAASAAARNAAIGAALAADPRIVFAVLNGDEGEPDAERPGTARVAVYVEPPAEGEAVRVDSLTGWPGNRPRAGWMSRC